MRIDDLEGQGLEALLARDEFHRRHVGPARDEQRAMLELLGLQSRSELIEQTVPASIRIEEPLSIGEPQTEAGALAEIRAIAGRNEVWRNFLGGGYHGTFTPEPIRRNVFENPGWYTAYTPYQAEIAQGRLEALMNFQQMIIDLTGLPMANASLLDEATAAGEAMTLIRRATRVPAKKFFVGRGVHPQVLAVLRTRARWLGIELLVDDPAALRGGGVKADEVFGAYLQTPDAEGRVHDFSDIAKTLHDAGAKLCIGTDPLASVLLKSVGAQGADVAVGTTQRFGIPLGFGGPHAAFMAVQEALVRQMPGRIIGLSKDAAGRPAYRMALQTREQHIRRDKATSNICTAQALLANMAAFYAVYHGPDGLRRIAMRTHAMARLLAAAIESRVGLKPEHETYFDTLTLKVPQVAAVRAQAESMQMNLRYLDGNRVVVALDETTTLSDVTDLAVALTGTPFPPSEINAIARRLDLDSSVIGAELRRTEPLLAHPVFNRYHSETEFMRYLKRLENKDISLVHSMIPLGSCTMKLNAASEMAPLSWPEFAAIHPHAPATQTRGYQQMFEQLGRWLSDVTGFAAVSFQPNSGAQGEYAGLLAIRNFQQANGQAQRDVCLIPASAHGTNPASAQMAGLEIVVVACDAKGNIDLDSLRAKIAQVGDRLSVFMVTYPSTHGVFEEGIRECCALVHAAGGQVYMDGANMNAQSGISKPGLIGADVCHLNLHKTFCIPHGGGGPGMGPIGVAAHLVPFLPADPHAPQQGVVGDSVSATAYSSALITLISWMYLRMMGSSGVRQATEVAILNANYIAARLEPHYPVLYRGAQGRIAHECILDLRKFKTQYGISAEDIAKRLMDYGFHAPTLSFPVADTLMVEPTESESKAELDRFCDAMIAIRAEVDAVAKGEMDAKDNVLRNAPHTMTEIAGEWTHGYSREQAAFPLPWVADGKVWPAVKRIDNAGGDRSLVCSCPPISEYAR